MSSTHDAILYKVAPPEEWQSARADDAYIGSPDDLRDGFIHLSTAEQVPGTLKRFFAGRGDLLLIAVDAAALGDTLRFEPAGDGTLFPHIYGPLPLDAVRAEVTLASDGAGGHRLPEGFGA